MTMGKIAISIILLLLTLMSAAQTQPGYVKTLGRPEKKGCPLGGVSVRVRGEHNPVLSKEDGSFSILLAGKKNGDAYVLQQVRKIGYELNETNVIGRQYAFSDKVPLTIVMVSSAQLQAAKLKIENNAYQVAERNYKAKLAFLEEQKEGKDITSEQYRNELQSLQDKFEKYQSLISSLAEHYAHTDYDLLNEVDYEINSCIENGHLERADSLIHTLFNPIDVLKRNKEVLSKIDLELIQANDIINQANASMAAVLKQQAKDAEYLYQLYTISLSRFDNQKAAQYIETRAELDTTNVPWQLAAGSFVSDFLADYPKAMNYYLRALRNSIEQFGEQHRYVAASYSNIGLIYDSQGNYIKALEYHQKALDIRLSILGKYHSDVAASYNNIGIVHKYQGDYLKALEHYQKALDINLSISGAYHPDVAVNYNNIGEIYSSLGDYPKALEYHQKALTMRLSILGEHHPGIATSYNNIGEAYRLQGNYPKALEYHQKALKILQSTLGEHHPNVAISYNNIGEVYYSQRNLPKALEYRQKALEILLPIFGEYHPEVAANYNNIGAVYDIQGDYTKALEYYQKALDIRQAMLGEHHPDVAASYNNIGIVYKYQGKYSKALEYYQKALDIRQSILGEQHPVTASSYNNIGMVYYAQKDYIKSLGYLQKALDIRENILGERHPDVATSYSNIGTTYFSLGNYPKALAYFRKALPAYMIIYGPNNESTQMLGMLVYNLFSISLLLSKDMEQDFDNFISEYAYTVTIAEEDCPASQQGMKGVYYLLQYSGWGMDSAKNIFAEKKEQQSKPNDMVVMNNGVITKYHLSNLRGCEFGLKYIGKEEKLHLDKAYNKWKEKHSDRL